MTAVNWLIEQIKNDQNQKALTGLEWMKVIEQAKEMEKQQIIDAYSQGDKDGYPDGSYTTGEEYYNQTYGSKGSDGNFKQFSLYEHKETIATADTPTSSQTEISGWEIMEAGKLLWSHPKDADFLKVWVQGAKWYREQLKKKQ